MAGQPEDAFVPKPTGQVSYPSPALQSSKWALCANRPMYGVHCLVPLVCCGSLLGIWPQQGFKICHGRNRHV